MPGVATGLAVTGVGGDVLYVEATSMQGTEGLTLTGQLGDVMKESAEIALSYIRSHAAELGIDPAAFTGRRFHLHVPAGAVPKDGPSAGVTMTTALVSLLRDEPVKSVLGMTGEVTLQGRVLPIGGVKQKVLAAHRAGLTEVVLPARNGPDLEDVPEGVRDQMTFHLAEEIGDVLPGGPGSVPGNGGDRPGATGRRGGRRLSDDPRVTAVVAVHVLAVQRRCSERVVGDRIVGPGGHSAGDGPDARRRAVRAVVASGTRPCALPERCCHTGRSGIEGAGDR